MRKLSFSEVEIYGKFKLLYRVYPCPCHYSSLWDRNNQFGANWKNKTNITNQIHVLVWACLVLVFIYRSTTTPFAFNDWRGDCGIWDVPGSDKKRITTEMKKIHRENNMGEILMFPR